VAPASGAAGTGIARPGSCSSRPTAAAASISTTARSRKAVTLDDPTTALYVAPWVWHELTDFAPQTAIVVIASSLYEEAEYLRDYDVFKREVAERST